MRTRAKANPLENCRAVPYKDRHRMDRSIKKQRYIVISTESFTPAEVDTLRSVLLDRYGIESTRCAQNKAKEQYIILFQKAAV
jgi:hypothetical protein